ncbi:MAG: amidohydrolase family protein, partial [Microbacterium sp.]
MTSRYLNGRIFTGDPDPSNAWAEAFAIDGDTIVFVGRDDDAPDADTTVDLAGRLVLPGFTDAHTHLLMMGAALGQVPLTAARTLGEIQTLLRAARDEAPDAAVLRGRGWLFDSIPGGAPTAAMIDAAIADIPVYLDANDYHSCWVNSAALAELGITRDTPDPLGGHIARDAAGEPTGLLYETAATQYAWAHRDATTTDADRDADVQRAIDAYLATGVTGVVDMAFDEFGLAAFERAQERHGGELPIRVAAHWIINNTGDDAANLGQVARAAELADRASTPWLRVVGIKLILDGVIDACTAAMRHPYADGSNAEPIWPLEQLRPVVAAADA